MAHAKEMQKTDPTVIGLAGGEPDFAAIGPHLHGLNAACPLRRAIPTPWWVPRLPELRQAIQKSCGRRTILDYDVNCIMVTPGGKNAIYLAVQAILNEGDEVLVLDPHSGCPRAPLSRAAGGVTVKVKLDYRQDCRITAEALEAACTDRLALSSSTTPIVPPGRILHRDEADILEGICLCVTPGVYAQRRGLKAGIRRGQEHKHGLILHPRHRATMINCSKSVAMTGWWAFWQLLSPFMTWPTKL